MPYWLLQTSFRYLQQPAVRVAAWQGARVSGASRRVVAAAQGSRSFTRGPVASPMSSAKRRLQLVNEQIRTPSTRAYASAGLQDDKGEAKVIFNVHQHSPGHNVATITVSNTRKLNIINTPIMEQFIEGCRELAKDEKLRVVVLTGAPSASGKAPSWIGGADIAQMSQMDSYDKAKTFITEVHNTCQVLRDLPVPVIAKVHGFSLGAGAEILAACDLRIATKASTFGMPEVKIGLPSVVEAALFPGLIGIGRTRRLLYLAENINAETAEKWGMVEKVVGDEAELDRATDEWVDTIVGMGPQSIRRQKRLMQGWENQTVDEGIQAGIEALAETFRDGGKEPKEYMAKFLNRKR